MRQVFTSQRIENVEGVARLLQDAGIDVRISNPRSYRGAIRGNFSYREQAQRGAQPEVWVLRSDDYPRARQLLREAGLEQRGHVAGGGFAGASMHGASGPVVARRPASRARRGALIAVALAVAAGVLGTRWLASRAPAPAPAASTVAPEGPQVITGATPVYRQATPPALAALLVEDALQAAPAGSRACVTIDGAAPPSDFASERLRARLLPADACAQAESLRIAIDDYRTDGSGVGTIRIADGTQTSQARVMEVQRTGMDWRVLGSMPAAATP
jgi:hypothetical protein